MPIASTMEPAKLPREQAAHVGGAVVGGATLVEQQPLGQQRAEHRSGELGEHVDDAVERLIRLIVDAASVTAGLKWPPLTTPNMPISPNSRKAWTSPTTAKSEPNWAWLAGGNEQHDDAGDEEDQQESADQLRKICGKSSFLHSFPPRSRDQVSGGSLPIFAQWIRFARR